jgi:hypothetical protein
MTDLSRRRFLVHSSIGLTAVVGGALVAGPHLAPGASSAPARVPDGARLALPMVMHVRDVATAEVSLMVGTTETIYRDRELVNRLLAAAPTGALDSARR